MKKIVRTFQILIIVLVAMIAIFAIGCSKDQTSTTGTTGTSSGDGVVKNQTTSGSSENPNESLESEDTTTTTTATPVNDSAASSSDLKNIKIEFVNLSILATANTKLNVTWTVSGDVDKVTNTHVYFGTDSDSREFGSAEDGLNYGDFTRKYESGNFTLPMTFTDVINVPYTAKAVYVRGHVLYDGKNYWTSEYKIPVTQDVVANVGSQATGEYRKIAIYADDYGFVPKEVNVTKGENIEMVFTTGSKNIYAKGIQIKAFGWPVITMNYNQTATVKFQANKTIYAQYVWFGTNNIKSVLKVNVIE